MNILKFFSISILFLSFQTNCSEAKINHEQLITELEILKDYNQSIETFLSDKDGDINHFLRFRIFEDNNSSFIANVLDNAFAHQCFNLLKFIIQNNINNEIKSFGKLADLAMDAAISEYNRTFKHKTHKYFLETYQDSPKRIKYFKNMITYLMQCKLYCQSQITQSQLLAYSNLDRDISISEKAFQDFMDKHDNYNDGLGCVIL